MASPLIVLGTSGLAKEVVQVAEQSCDAWHVKGFVGATGDAAPGDGWPPLLGDDDWLAGWEGAAELVTAIGLPAVRARVWERHAPQRRFATLVHERAVLDRGRLTCGTGVIVSAGVVVTADVVLGDDVHLNLNVTVGHEARIGSHGVVNPGANISGGVTLGERVLVGTGAQLLQGVSVGDGAIVGAGAVVTKDVPPDVTVVGVPAAPLS